MPGPTLDTVARELLARLSAADHGAGVHFDELPNGAWQMTGTAYAAPATAFQTLAAAGLADVGDFNDSPVRINPAGRDYLRSPTATMPADNAPATASPADTGSHTSTVQPGT